MPNWLIVILSMLAGALLATGVVLLAKFYQALVSLRTTTEALRAQIGLNVQQLLRALDPLLKNQNLERSFQALQVLALQMPNLLRGAEAVAQTLEKFGSFIFQPAPADAPGSGMPIVATSPNPPGPGASGVYPYSEEAAELTEREQAARASGYELNEARSVQPHIAPVRIPEVPRAPVDVQDKVVQTPA